MEHDPDEYGEYWAAAIRVAAGVLVVLFTYRVVQPFVALDPWPAKLLGWIVLAGAVFAGSFAVCLGLARVVETASR